MTSRMIMRAAYTERLRLVMVLLNAAHFVSTAPLKQRQWSTRQATHLAGIPRLFPPPPALLYTCQPGSNSSWCGLCCSGQKLKGGSTEKFNYIILTFFFGAWCPWSHCAFDLNVFYGVILLRLFISVSLK